MVGLISDSDKKIKSILDKYCSKQRKPELLVCERDTHRKLDSQETIIQILEDWKDPRAERIKSQLQETRKNASFPSPLIIVDGGQTGYYSLNQNYNP